MAAIRKSGGFMMGRLALMAVLAMAGLMMMSSVQAKDDDRLRVVASISILADMVEQVGGDRVQVTHFVGADADAHAFEPAPKDAKALGAAQVLVINGIDFEFWLPRLLASSSFKGREVIATQGITPRRLNGTGQGHDHDHAHADGHKHDEAAKHADDHKHDHDHDHDDKHDDDHKHADDHKQDADHVAVAGHDHHHHGEFDPHAWQDLGNAVIYVRNIAQGLIAADPANQAYYAQRAADYEAKIKALDQELKQAFGELPQGDRKVITQHDAFGYFAQAYGIDFISAVGISSAAEPSAKEVAAIIAQAREHNIKGIFVENISNPRMVQQIAKESGARVGGTLYSDAVASAGHPADTYLGMMQWNAKQLLEALKPAQ